MKTVTEFPHEIIEEENVWVPVPEGLRLAARIWRPAGSDDKPVPAILEYIPYRKRFGSTVRDEMTHKFLAGHGYACIRLDIRGSGESEGVLQDEYLQSELEDGLAALEWIARQSWCDGNIGMMGISWGGFNALQIAALRPRPLKAVVSVCSSDDRYADDIHHMGGALLGDNLSWASVMFSYNTMPPDPALVGHRWREMWHERLEGSGLWLKTWLQHQRRDAYWRHGSICENYDDINIPVLAVSGWTDGYTNTVFRLLKNLKAPCKGLVGPWGHTYPHIGSPGPAIDFLSELLRWWDRWLKGENTGVEKDPALRVWMQDSVPPNPRYDYRPGRWVAEPGWPSSQIEPAEYTLSTGRHLVAAGEPAPTHGLKVQSPVTLGLFAGKWCSYTKGPDLASDQRLEDGGGLVFQTPPLEHDVEILGAPEIELELSSDKPVAMIVARLSDMRPDHQLTRVTYGMLNLTHRNSRRHPEPLEPGRRYRVRFALNNIAQRFPAGHRIRLSLSTVYWPLAWPSPESTRLTVWTALSRLFLPVRPPRIADERLRDLGEPQAAEKPSMTFSSIGENTWKVEYDLAQEEATLRVVDDRGVFRLDDIDLTVGARSVEAYSATIGDFSSAAARTEWHRSLSRGDWSVRTRTCTRLHADKENFYLTAELDAYEGSRRVTSLNWDETIRRDHL